MGTLLIQQPLFKHRLLPENPRIKGVTRQNTSVNVLVGRVTSAMPLGANPKLNSTRETLSLASPQVHPGLFTPQQTLSIASVTRSKVALCEIEDRPCWLNFSS